MRMCIIFFAMVLMIMPMTSIADNVGKVTGEVQFVRIENRSTDVGCIEVGSEVFKVDLSTNEGRSTFSLAMTALMGDKTVQALWYADEPLEGGCDTGTTMHPLYFMQMNK